MEVFFPQVVSWFCEGWRGDAKQDSVKERGIVEVITIVQEQLYGFQDLELVWGQADGDK